MAFILTGKRSGYGPLAPVVKGVAASIGLASESIHHYKENKAATKEASLSRENSDTSLPPPPSYEELEAKRSASRNDVRVTCLETVEEKDETEKEWELDEAQDELTNISKPDQKQTKRPDESDPKKFVKHFTDAHPAPAEAMERSLSLPVILPQRRPKDRTRGFIRAYAPELQNSGINEAMFMDFLETFNTATQASPWLDAINLASFAFWTLPFVVGQAAQTALAIAVDITKNLQSRHRHNYVLDQLNNDFFRPRGLYALVLTWNPAVDDVSIGVNINETIGQNLRQPQGVVEKAKHSFRPSMGNTNGVVFNETAPLSFPVLDGLARSTNQEAKTYKEKYVLAKSFLADYSDRRAQARYAGENPDSGLLVAPKPQFKSRFSDPNSAAASGSLIGLVTGGKVVIPPKGHRIAAIRSWSDSRAQAKAAANNEEKAKTDQELTQTVSAPTFNDIANEKRALLQANNNSGGLYGVTVGRVLRQHVLYLMIVNMPSESELAEATRNLKQAEAQHESS